MNEAWFDPNMYSWIPGTLIGIIGGIEGTLAGIFASRGKLKKLILGFHFAAIGISALCLIFAIIALLTKQPYGIWFGFGLTGVIGIFVVGGLTPVVFKSYKEAEMRKTIAEDI